MGSDAKAIATPARVNALRLAAALDQSQQVKDKVEECAQELSSINKGLKQEVTERLSLAQVEQALHESAEVEIKVQECADDLSVVNQALGQEVRERKKLERKLAKGRIALAGSQAELAEMQVQATHAHHLALHDVVTGLPNRSLLNDRLKSALAQARRHTWCLAVMFIDLDKFKSINDTHGHEAGDRVLKIMSDRLKHAVRDTDTVGRQGGDEFVYLMLETKDDREIAAVAEKIVANIALPCEFDGLELIVKPSIGIALYPQDGRSANVLLKNADSAMYKAKKSDKAYSFFNRD